LELCDVSLYIPFLEALSGLLFQVIAKFDIFYGFLDYFIFRVEFESDLKLLFPQDFVTIIENNTASHGLDASRILKLLGCLLTVGNCIRKF
jgi:hypothetical protein